MYTFVSGGYRSGRSNYALRRASELGPPPWLYVATGQEPDDAIRKRIEHHRRDAEAIWRTAVMPARLTDLVAPENLADLGAVVLDGVAVWIEARLGEVPGEKVEHQIRAEIAELADRMYRSRVPVVVVSIEMGLGGRPRNEGEERVLRVVCGANQILAAQASGVVLMVSGVAFKGP